MTKLYKKKIGRIRMKENCKEYYFLSLVKLHEHGELNHRATLGGRVKDKSTKSKC